VDSALEREDIRHHRRRPHKAGCVAISVNDVDLGCHRAEPIQVGAFLDSCHHVGVGPRAHLPALVAVADHLAIAPRTEPHMMVRLRPIGRDGEALIAGGDQLDRTVDLARGSAIRAVRGVMPPLEPKAPPTKWLTTRTLSASTPSRCATPFLRP